MYTGNFYLSILFELCNCSLLPGSNISASQVVQEPQSLPPSLSATYGRAMAPVLTAEILSTQLQAACGEWYPLFNGPATVDAASITLDHLAACSTTHNTSTRAASCATKSIPGSDTASSAAIDRTACTWWRRAWDGKQDLLTFPSTPTPVFEVPRLSEVQVQVTYLYFSHVMSMRLVSNTPPPCSPIRPRSVAIARSGPIDRYHVGVRNVFYPAISIDYAACAGACWKRKLQSSLGSNHQNC
jgi:hypothetical protein